MSYLNLQKEHDSRYDSSHQESNCTGTASRRWTGASQGNTFSGMRLEGSIHVRTRAWVANLLGEDIAKPNASMKKILSANHLTKVLGHHV